MNICVRACTLGRTCMDGIHAHTYKHTRTHIHTHTVHIRAYIRMHTHTYLRTYVHACMHTYMYSFIRTYIHTYTHEYIHTFTHTRIHACIHTYIHSHVHAPTQIKNGDYCAHVHQHSQALLKSTSSLLRSDSLTDRAIAIAVCNRNSDLFFGHLLSSLIVALWMLGLHV